MLSAETAPPFLAPCASAGWRRHYILGMRSRKSRFHPPPPPPRGGGGRGTLSRRRQTTGPRPDSPQKPRGKNAERKDGIDGAAKRKRAPKKNNSQRKKKETKKEGQTGAPQEGRKRHSAPPRGKGTEKRQASERKQRKREALRPEPGIRPRRRAARGG